MRLSFPPLRPLGIFASVVTAILLVCPPAPAAAQTGALVPAVVPIVAASALGQYGVTGAIAGDGAGNLYAPAVDGNGNGALIKISGPSFNVAPSVTQLNTDTLSSPVAVVLDAQGHLWVADNGANTLVEYSTAGGAALNTVSAPGVASVASGNDGTLYFSDGNSIFTVAPGASNAVPTGISVGAIVGFAVDANGAIYVASGAQVFKSSRPWATSVPVAGGGSNPNYEGVAATSAALSNITGLAIDASNNLDIDVANDGGSNSVVQVNALGTLHTIAGAPNGFATSVDVYGVQKQHFAGLGAPSAASEVLLQLAGTPLSIDALGRLLTLDSNGNILAMPTQADFAQGNGTLAWFFQNTSVPTNASEVETLAAPPVTFFTAAFSWAGGTSASLGATPCVAGGTVQAINSGTLHNQFCEIDMNESPTVVGVQQGSMNLNFDATTLTLPLTGTGLGAIPAAMPMTLAATQPLSSGPSISDPLAVARDPWGNIYFGVLGTGAGVYRIHAGVATQIEPGISAGNDGYGLAFDAAGNMYFSAGNAVYEAALASLSNSIPSFQAPVRILSAASNVRSLLVDNAGNLYVADITSVDKYSWVNGSLRPLEHIAGTNVTGNSASGSLAATANLNTPDGLALDASGNLYIADAFNSRIVKVSGGILTTVAATVTTPFGLALDAGGNLYIADDAGGTAQVIPANGATGPISILPAGSGISKPTGIAIDGAGNIFIADLAATGNASVRELSPPNGSVAFGSFAVHSTNTATLTILNMGNQPLTWNQSSAVSPSSGEFSGAVPVTGTGVCNTSAAIAAGSYCLTPLTFVPSNTGVRTGVVSYFFANANFLTVNATGTGAQVATHIFRNAGNGQSVAVNSGFPINLQALVEDQSGNPMPGATVVFSAPAGLTTASGIFHNGSQTYTTVTDANGLANALSFTSDNVAGTYTITASVSGTSPLLATGFTLTNTATSTPTSLAFVSTIPTSTAGVALSSVAVEVKDQNGAVITTGSGSTDSVTINIASGPGSFASGTLTATAIAGVATFPNLIIDKAGSYSLGATDTTHGLAGSSNTFTVVAAAPAAIVVTLPANVYSGESVTATDTAVDAFGNPAIDSNLVQFTSSDHSAGLPPPAALGTVAVTFRTLGAQSLTVTDLTTSITGSATTNVVATNLTFPNTPVNTPATTPQTATFIFSATRTLAPVSVVTQGYSGLDFSNLGGGTCAAQTYTAGQSCTVVVGFTPTAIGQRLGAVVLKDTAGTVLQTVYVSGVGTGPIAQFQTVATLKTVPGATQARGLSFDAQGNLFYLDAGTTPNKLMEVFAGSNVAQLVANLPTGTVGGGATAVDGAGNLYVAFDGNNTIYQYIGGGNLQAIATPGTLDDNLVVGGAGNLFASDGSTGAIYKIASGTHAITTVLTGGAGHRFIGMAIDTAGNLYAADYNSSTLYELPVGASSLTTLLAGGGLSNPHAVAVDPAGNVYVGNNVNNGAVVRYDAGTHQSKKLLGVTGNQGLGFDPTGMLYGVVNNTSVVEYSRSIPPALGFDPTVVGNTTNATAVPMENDGNAALVITGDSASANFGINAGANTCAGSVASGTTCQIGASFTPTSAAALNGTLTLTDNNLGVANSSQVLPLSGTGLQTTQAITFAPLANQVYGTPAFTLSATGGGSGNPVTFSITSGAAFATLSGANNAILTMIGAGSVTVTANQAGNVSYSAAPAVSQSFTITPATLTVTANNVSINYGQTVPTLTAAYSGFANSDTAAVLTGSPALSATYTAPIQVGSYSIVATAGSLAASNYVFRFVNGTLNVAQATVTPVLATTISKVYDTTTSATLSSSLQLTGLQNGDQPTIAFTSAHFADANVGTSKPVTVQGISISGAASGNYTLAATSVTANVGTITAALATPTMVGTAIKNYDGTTTATLLPGNFSLAGILGTDQVVVTAGSANYATPDAGTGLPLFASGLQLSGPSAGNYMLPFVGMVGSIGVINPVAPAISDVSNPAIVNYPQGAGILVTATGVAGGQQPRGTYSVSVDGGAAITSPVSVNNPTGIALGVLAPGVHNVTVAYSGLGDYAAASGNPVSITVLQTATQLQLVNVPGFEYVGGNLGAGITVNVLDAFNNIVGGSTAPVSLALVCPNLNDDPTANAAAGVASFDLSSQVLPTAGGCTVTASSPGLTSAVANVTVVPTTITFPGTPVGTPSPSQPITVAFPNGGTVASLTVVTQGLSGFDFNADQASTSNCVASFTAGQSCTVNVIFKPTQVGTRLGAVILYDAGGNVIQTLYLTGIGQGAMAAFTGAPATKYNNGLVAVQTASDPQGNLFVVNGSGTVEELPFANFGSPTFPGGHANLGLGAGGAIDGAGNFYYGAGGTIFRVPNVGGTLQFANQIALTSSGTNVLTIDPSGNLFNVGGDGNLYETLAGTTAPIHLLGGLGNVQGMVFGNDGKLYATSYQTGKIFQITLNGTGAATIQVAGTPGGNPMALGIDPAGDLYYDDYSTGNLYMISIAGGTYNFTSPTLLGKYPNARGITFDRWGMYVNTDAGAFYAIDLATAPAQTFPQTNVGATSASQSFGLINTGNQSMSIGAITFDANFPNQGSSCTGNLDPGATCSLVTAFSPTAAGNPVSGSLVIAASAINESASQTSAETGTAVQQNQTINLTAGEASVVYGAAPVAINASASSGLPVALSVSGPGTLSGNSVAITGVGTITVTANQAGNADFAAAPSVSVQVQVTAAQITAILGGSANKQYDGTAAATLSAANFSFSGKVGSDDINLVTPTVGVYDSKNVGTGKVVTASGISLSGTAAGNYTLASSTISAAIGLVNPAPVTITLTGTSVKTYDGTTAAPIGSGNFTVATIFGSDVVKVSFSGATYDTPNAGTGKTVTAVGLALSGADAANYQFSATTASGPIGIVNKASTTASAVLDPSSVQTYGQNQSVDLALTRVAGGQAPGGTYTVVIDGNLPGATTPVNVNGSQSFGLGSLAVGNHTVTVSYGGDTNYNSATATPLSFTVNQASPLYQVNTPAPYTYGQLKSVIVTFQTTGSEVTPTGSLTFSVDGGAPQTLPIAGAGVSLPLGLLTPGSHAITISYSGDGNFIAVPVLTGVGAIQVNAAPTVVNTNPQPTATVTYATAQSVNVQLSAAGTGTASPSGTLTYTVNGSGGGTATLAGGAASLSFGILTPGTYTIAINYPGDTNYAASTGSVVLTVNQGHPRGFTPHTQNSVYGGDARGSITLLSTSGGSVPTGAVTYYLDGVLQPNQITLDATGTATFDFGSQLGAGSHTFGFVYLGDSNYLGISSSPTQMSFQVSKVPLTVVVDNKTRQFGAADPTFTGTLSGVVNNDGITATYSSTANATSPAGTPVAITATLVDPNGQLANYTVTNTPGVLTITAASTSVAWSPASGSIVYGSNLSAVLNAIGSDGNGITYTIAGSPVSGATVEPVGTYTITATLAADNNHQSSTATFALTVTPAPLSVVVDNQTRQFGAADPTFTGTVTGVVNNDIINVTYSAADSASSPAGTPVAITANVSGAALSNYNLTNTPGVLTITPATTTTTWTPSSGSIVYGTNLAALLNATSSDGGAISYTINGNPVTATSVLPAGPYTILATLPADNNHQTSTATFALTVTQAPLSVVVGNQTRIFGIANPTLTGSVTGAVNGDVISAAYATTAGVTSPAGTYAITATLTPSSLPNYKVTNIPGVLTITDAPQSITFAPVTAPLFIGNPVTVNLSASASSGLPVFFTVTGPATLSGSVLTVTGTGTVTVTASDDVAGSSYLPATPVTQVLNIVPGYGWGLYAASGVCNALNLTGNAKIDSFDSTAGIFSLTHQLAGGNAGSNGSADLDGNAKIYGALFDPWGNTAAAANCNTAKLASGGLADLGDASHITGGIVKLPTPVAFPAPVIPAAPTTTQTISSSCGSVTGCGETSSKNVYTLAPGAYGNLTVSGNAQINLSAGSYTFNSLTLSGNSVLRLTSGPVVINIAGVGQTQPLSFTGKAIIDNGLAPANLVVRYGGSGQLNLTGGDTTSLLVYAPSATVNLTGNADFYGSIIGGIINMTGNGTVHYDRSLGMLGVVSGSAGATAPPAL